MSTHTGRAESTGPAVPIGKERVGGHRAAALAIAAMMLVEVLYFLPMAWGWHDVFFHLLSPHFTGETYRRTLPPALTRIQSHDVTGVVMDYPDAFYTASQMRRGNMPFWNPDIGCGRAWIGNAQVFPFSPLLLPMILHPSPWTQTLQFLLGSLVCLFGSWLFFRKLGAGETASAVGAVLWACNPFTAIALQMSSVWAYWWMPWILWGLWTALGDGRFAGWLAAGAALAMAALCGQPETVLYLGEMVALFALAGVALGRPEGRSRLWGIAGLVCTAASAAALSAAQWVPNLAVLYDSVWYKTAVTPADLTLHATAFMTMPREHSFLMPVLWGAAVLLLRRPKRWEVAGFSVMLLYCMALYIPSITHSLPFRLLRGGGILPPLHGAELAFVPLTALAVLGLLSLPEWPARWTRVEWSVSVLALLVSAGLTVEACYGWLSLGWDQWMPVLWLLAALGAFVLLLWSSETRTRVQALALLGLFLATYPLAAVWFRYPDFSGAPQPEWRTFLGPPEQVKRGEPPGRIWAQASPRNGIPFLIPNLNLLDGYCDVRASMVMNPPGSKAFYSAWGEKGRLFGLFYNLGRATPQLLAFMGVDRAVLEARTPGRMFRVVRLRAGPRAFFVRGITALDSEGACLAEFKSMLKEKRLYESAAILAKQSASPPTAGGAEAGDAPSHVRWLAYTPERIKLQVDAPTAGLLVVTDAYTRRWEARVDGAPAPLYRTDVMFRGVPVPAGTHTVEMVYDARSMVGSMVFSLIAWLALGAALWGIWWRRRKVTRLRPPTGSSGARP